MFFLSTKTAALLGGAMLLALPLGVVAPRFGSAGHSRQMKPNPATVTGCLQVGDEKNEFVLLTKDGKSYEVESSTLSLAPHLGHTVTVKGKLVPQEDWEKAEKAREGERMEREGEQAEHDGNSEKGEKMEEQGQKMQHDATKDESFLTRAPEIGHVQVTSLKMISPQCQIVLH